MMYPLSELIDRYSILLLKCERLPEHHETLSERWRFQGAIAQFIDGTYDTIDAKVVDAWISEAKYYNAAIWDLESDIRKGKEGELGLEEVGRRALLIRDLNKKRIEVKNKVAGTRSEYKEIKIDHASQ